MPALLAGLLPALLPGLPPGLPPALPPGLAPARAPAFAPGLLRPRAGASSPGVRIARCETPKRSFPPLADAGAPALRGAAVVSARSRTTRSTARAAVFRLARPIRGDSTCTGASRPVGTASSPSRAEASWTVTRPDIFVRAIAMSPSSIRRRITETFTIWTRTLSPSSIVLPVRDPDSRMCTWSKSNFSSPSASSLIMPSTYGSSISTNTPKLVTDDTTPSNSCPTWSRMMYARYIETASRSASIARRSCVLALRASSASCSVVGGSFV